MVESAGRIRDHHARESEEESAVIVALEDDVLEALLDPQHADG